MPDNVYRIKEVDTRTPLLDPFIDGLQRLAEMKSAAAAQSNAGWHALAMSFAELTHKFVNDDGVSGSMSREDHAKALELLRKAGW